MVCCDICGTPVHEEDYYEEYDMCICPDCLSASEEELMWLDEQGSPRVIGGKIKVVDKFHGM